MSELKRALIGGSDVAGILGLSEYKSNTPFQWWRRHFGLEPPLQETMKMTAGKALEPALDEWYTKKTGIELAPCDLILDPEQPWFGVNPDRVSKDGKRNVEFKMVGFRVAMKLGEAGTDEVITDHLLQGRAQEGVLRANGYPIEAVDWVYWNWDWPEPQLFTADADLDIYIQIRAQLQGFKESYIDTAIPPPVDGSEAAAQHIKELFPTHAEGKYIVGDQQIDQLAQRLYEITAQGWDNEAEEGAIKQSLQMYMGDAEALDTQMGKFSWKNNKDSEKVDWKGLAEMLLNPLSSAEQARLLAQRTTIVPGPRVFRTPFRKGK